MDISIRLGQILKERPVSPDEVARAQAALTLTLPRSWETMKQLADAIAELITFGLPDRYFGTYAESDPRPDARGGDRDRGQGDRPDRLIWVIVGDRAKIEPGIRGLNIGEVRVVDVTGKPTT